MNVTGPSVEAMQRRLKGTDVQCMILMKNGNQVHLQHMNKGMQDKYNRSNFSVHS